MEKAEKMRRGVRMQRPYFPLFVDISQKKIIVIGGGRVARRRVKTLLEFAECVCVISPALTEELRRLAETGRIDWIRECYTAERIAEADIVLAATDDASCNEQIVRDCKARGIPVNTAHKKELCDFYFPAVVVKENVVAGITAGGCGHMQAREARRRVEKALENIQEDEDWYE